MFEVNFKAPLYAALAAAILMVAIFFPQAGSTQTGSAHLVEVVSVAPSYEEEQQRGYGRTAAGAGIGGAIGALATRNSSQSSDRYAAAALGAAIGGAIGNRRDRNAQRVRGFDVVVRYDNGRLGSIFLKEVPPVGVGEFAYLVGNYSRTRLIPAPNEPALAEAAPTAAYYR
jgi:outer membrane lipoprotein SlyB